MRSLNGHLACLLSSGKNRLKFMGGATGKEEENVNHISKKNLQGIICLGHLSPQAIHTGDLRNQI